MTVRFTTATALTAGPAELDPDSVVILDGTTLSFGETVTTHPNRGFKIDGAVINVDDGKVVTIRGPVVAANGFTKTGGGTLCIAGDVSGLDTGKVVVSAGEVVYGKPPIVATVTGAKGLAGDGPFFCTLGVTVPTTDWTALWYNEDDDEVGANAPTYNEEGTYTNVVKVTAEGYQDFYGTGVVTVIAEYYTHEVGSTDWTVAVQSYDAIVATVEACHAGGGGRIVVPAGTYPECRTIRLYSNQEFHLETGATIVGSQLSADYTDVPEEVFALTIENSRKAFITAYNEDGSRLENIKLTGSGTIDGQGPAFFPNQTGTLWPKTDCPARPLMVRIFKCDGLEITGLTFQNSPVWTMQIRECTDFFVEGITIDNNQHMTNSDGIDVDGCQNVMIRNSSFTTGDDCIIMRAITYDKTIPIITENVVVSNCVLNSACQVIRMGCPSDDTIRHIYMKDITVSGTNGINFDYPNTYIRSDIHGYMDITDCVFENIHGSLSACAINISVTTTAAEDALRCVDGVTFRDCTLSSAKPLNFSGRVDSPVCNVTLENCAFNNCGYTAKYAPGFKMINTTFNGVVPTAWQPYEGEEYPFLRLPGTSTASSGTTAGSGIMTGRTYADAVSNAFTVGFCVRNPSAKGVRAWNSDRCGYIAGNGTYDNTLGGFAVAFIEKCTDSTGATAVGARLALRVAESSNLDMAELTLLGSDENRTDAAALLDGDWHRVYVTYDATAEKAACYIDGECVKEIAGSDLANWYQALGTRPFAIGRHPAGTGFNFAGDLAQVALFDRALSAAEVAAIDAPLAGTEANLVGYWPLDEGATSFAGDRRGGNNGSVANGADNTNAYWAYDEEPILVPEVEPTMHFDAAVAGYSGEYDGIAHACALTVTDPAAGYEQKWAWQGEGDFTHATPQSCTAVGSYTNVVRLTAPGYFEFYGTGVVEIAAAPTPPSAPQWIALYTEQASSDTSTNGEEMGNYTAYYCTVEAAQAIFGSSAVDAVTQYLKNDYETGSGRVASEGILLDADEYGAGQYGFIKYDLSIPFVPYLGFVFYDKGETNEFRVFGADNLEEDDTGLSFDDTEPGTVGGWTKPSTPGIPVGEGLSATFADGVCTISGTGAMWAKAKLGDLRALAITNLVIGEGITSISEGAFANMWSIRDVTIGSTVANIGAQSFLKCYNLTNVVIRTGVTAPTVGEYAFFRCNSLVRITVTGDSSVNWGDNAFTLQAGIFMNSATGLPEIYPIPEVVDANGSVTVLYGTNDLGGDDWTEITSDADRKNYHFFKIKFEKK